jgi:hypothetical protein
MTTPTLTIAEYFVAQMNVMGMAYYPEDWDKVKTALPAAKPLWEASYDKWLSNGCPPIGSKNTKKAAPKQYRYLNRN